MRIGIWVGIRIVIIRIWVDIRIGMEFNVGIWFSSGDLVDVG